MTKAPLPIGWIYLAMLLLLPLATAAIWWWDGGWEQGAMPTSGVLMVGGASGLAIICHLLGRWCKARFAGRLDG